MSWCIGVTFLLHTGAKASLGSAKKIVLKQPFMILKKNQFFKSKQVLL